MTTNLVTEGLTSEEIVASLQGAHTLMQQNYQRAQNRTFEMSEELTKRSAEIDDLRDLIKRLALHCMPNLLDHPIGNLDGIWLEARRAMR